MSDVMHGRGVVVGDKKKRKSYLIGIIDDATRLDSCRSLVCVEREHGFVLASAGAGGAAPRSAEEAVRGQRLGIFAPTTWLWFAHGSGSR